MIVVQEGITGSGRVAQFQLDNGKTLWTAMKKIAPEIKTNEYLKIYGIWRCLKIIRYYATNKEKGNCCLKKQVIETTTPWYFYVLQSFNLLVVFVSSCSLHRDQYCISKGTGN